MKLEFNCTLSQEEVETIMRKFFDMPDTMNLTIDHTKEGGIYLFIKSSDYEDDENIIKWIKTKFDFQGKNSAKEDILQESLEDHLSVRAWTILRANKVTRFGELIGLSATNLLHFRNFGKHSLKEVQKLLQSKGLRLKD